MIGPVRYLKSRMYARLQLSRLQSNMNNPAFMKDVIGDLFKRGMEHMLLKGAVTDPITDVGAVYIAQHTVASSMASVTWSLFDGNRKGAAEIEEHPVHTLLEDMSSNMGSSLYGNALIEGTQTWLDCKGRAFWWLNPIVGGVPRGIQLIAHPEEMKPKFDANKQVVAWRSDKLRMTFPIEELVRFAHFDHRDPYGGLATLEAARLGYNINWKSSKFQDLFYRHGGIPPFYIKLPEQATMVKDDADALKEQFAQEYLSLLNAWKVPVMMKGATLESIAVNQKDAEWIATQRLTTRQILAIYGVPAGIAGFTEDANRSVTVEERRAFWGRTMVNRGEIIRSAVQAQLLNRYFSGVFWKWDWIAKFMQVMPEETRAGIDAADKLIGRGVSPAQAYGMFNIPIDTTTEPWLLEGWLPFGVQPARVVLEDALAEPEPVPPALVPDEDDDPPVDEDPPDDGEGEEVDPDAAFYRPRKELSIVSRSVWPKGDKLRTALWKQFESEFDKLERLFIGQWRGWLKWFEDEIIDKLQSGTASLDARLPMSREMLGDAIIRSEPINAAIIDDVLRVMKADGDEFFPTEEQFKAEAARRTDGATKRSVKRGWEIAAGEVGLNQAFDLTDPRVMAIIEGRKVRIKGASVQTRNRMRHEIAIGVSKGESVDTIARRIKRKFGEERRGQAKTIARTEPASGFSCARNEVFTKVGITETEWLSARDDLVRNPLNSEFNHAIDGETALMGDPFTNDLMFPLDPAGAPGNVINCRCVALPVK